MTPGKSAGYLRALADWFETRIVARSSSIQIYISQDSCRDVVRKLRDAAELLDPPPPERNCPFGHHAPECRCGDLLP
jgi:hypothetical protein